MSLLPVLQLLLALAFLLGAVIQRRSSGLHAEFLAVGAWSLALCLRLASQKGPPRATRSVVALPYLVALGALMLTVCGSPALELLGSWLGMGLGLYACLPPTGPAETTERLRWADHLAGTMYLAAGVLAALVSSSASAGAVWLLLLLPPALELTDHRGSRDVATRGWRLRCGLVLLAPIWLRRDLEPSCLAMALGVAALHGLALSRRRASATSRPARLALLTTGAVLCVLCFARQAAPPEEWRLAFERVTRLVFASGALVAAGWTCARVRGHGRGVRGALTAVAWLILAMWLVARPGPECLPTNRLLDHVPLIVVAIGCGALAACQPSLGRTLIGSQRRVARKWRLLVALPALASLPTTLTLVLRWWDCSGYMDAYVYDVLGHRIALGVTPQGSGFYMPLYQYFLAATFWTLGHVFWAQQLCNVLLLSLGRVLVCLAAWLLFRRSGPLLMVGTLIAFSPELHAGVHVTAIENLYVPLVCATLAAWAAYLRRPDPARIALLGACIALTLNTRVQGAFFLAVLALSPVLVPATWSRRATHVAALGAIVAAGLLPWSLRNWVWEGRFSPSSTQSVALMAALNDPRVGLYGIRYDIGFAEVMAEYHREYPDPETRLAVMRDHARTRILGDPLRLVTAAGWRTLAFYNALPPGVWHPGGPAPTDWSRDGWSYVYQASPYLGLVALSLLGLAARPGRVGFFLLGCVMGNLAIVLFSGFGEPRLSHPVFPLHMLLAATILAPPAGSRVTSRSRVPRAKHFLAAMLAAAAVIGACRWMVGARYLRRPLQAPGLRSADRPPTSEGPFHDLDPFLAEGWREGPLSLPPGVGVQLHGRLSNYQFPSLDHTSPDAGHPVFSLRWQFLRLFPGRMREVRMWEPEPPLVVAHFEHAVSDGPLREWDSVLVSGRLLSMDPGGSVLWIEALEVRHVPDSLLR